MPQDLEIWAVSAVLTALVLVWFLMDRMRSNSRYRGRAYAAAAEYLKAHYAAMERVVSDPSAPQEAVEMLLAISEISADRGRSIEFAQFLCARPTGNGGSTASFHAEMERLRKHRPDLVSDFETAVSKGLVALFLRWPETTEILPKFLEGFSNPKSARDASIAAERFWTQHKGGRSGPHLGAPPAVMA